MKLDLRRISAALLVFAASGALYAQGWTKVGGTAPFVHKLYFPASQPAFVLAAADSFPVGNELTNNSIYYYWGQGPDQTNYIANGFRVSSDSGKTFGAPLLEGHSVRDIIEAPNMPGTWLAAVARGGSSGGILISNNNGANWSGLNAITDFDPRCGSNNVWPFVRLASHGTGSTIYSLAANQSYPFRSSQDTFNTCAGDSVYASARDISASKIAAGLVYIADQLAGVHRSTDFGQTWTTSTEGIQNVRLLSIMASSANPAIVLAGGDSLMTNQNYAGKGIYQSLDSGKTWQWVGAPGARVWEIREHPLDPRYVIAAGDSSGAWISGNFGRAGSWQQINSGLPANLPVRTAGFPAWSSDGGVIAFAGLADIGGGLYRSDRIFIEPSSVEESGQASGLAILGISPQPVRDNATLLWKNSGAGKARIGLRDILGRELAVIADMEFGDGEQALPLELGNLPQGSYFLVIQSGSSTVTEKIVVLR